MTRYGSGPRAALDKIPAVLGEAAELRQGFVAYNWKRPSKSSPRPASGCRRDLKFLGGLQRIRLRARLSRAA